MELRVLRYFLAMAREESISGAAEHLHLSQPTLSRQLMDMEQELGVKLFLRGNRRITLTEEGTLLRKRAEEILALVEKTVGELTAMESELSGELYIGAGETEGVHFLTRTVRQIQKQHPQLRFHISSGDTMDVMEQLDKGLIDFGLLFDPINQAKYNFYQLPVRDTWGILMRRDSPLAQKKTVRAKDLLDKPLIISRNLPEGSPLDSWLGRSLLGLNIAATYNLAYNASLMVEDGIGYALTLDGIINTSGDSLLCFRPLAPALHAHMSVVWKKYQVFSRAAEKFIEALRQEMPEGSSFQ